MSRQESQDCMTIPHFIRKEKEIVVLKCLACNWTNCSFVLRELLAVGCYVLLEINDGFFFDRALSRALVNKFKGQQGHMSFLAGNTANRAGDTVFVKKGRSPFRRSVSSSKFYLRTTVAWPLCLRQNILRNGQGNPINANIREKWRLRDSR